jgi:hypothetical protein
MSAPAMSLPSSIKPNTKKDSTQEEIANLAYALWQERGTSSDGSPEKDWIDAELLLRNE